MKKKHIKNLRVLFLVLFSLMFVGILSLTVILEPSIKIHGYKALDKTKLSGISKSAVFFDTESKVVEESIFMDSSIYASLKDLPTHAANAFLSVEDKRFYKHHGVDYVRIAGALLKNISNMSYKEGASTISQQLIKNTHLNNEKSLNRKIQEVRIAKMLERKYKKKDILEMYLNCLYFGNNIYGIGMAAKVFFDKSASALTVNESAMLAGIINNPLRYCPYRHYADCMSRKNIVLKRMLENNVLPESEYLNLVLEDIELTENNELLNHYFNAASLDMSGIFGNDVWKIKGNNYIVNTYFDENISKIIEQCYKGTDFYSKNDADFCCIVINNENSTVLAYFGTGRRNYSNYLRSPASAIKPIISYAPALEKQLIYPITPILDEKASFGNYSPSNYQNKYTGWNSIENALAQSSNAVAVRLLYMNGIEYSKDIGQKMGLTFSENDNHLALALGGMEYGLTLEQLATAYCSFARGGEYKKLGYIKSVTDKRGNVIYEDTRRGVRAVKEETAYFINSMLKQCVTSGTAKRLNSIKNIAAKTGTAGTKKGNSDAYCISYSKDFTVAVWLGSKGNTLMPNSISGGTIPAMINKNIYSKIVEYAGACDDFIRPKDIVDLHVDKASLENDRRVVIANDMTPASQKIPAIFDKKNLPTEQSIKYFNKFILHKEDNVFSA